jgi:hypothetical protein
LKLKLAFAKNGVGIGKDHNSNVLSGKSAEDFFKNIEEKVSQSIKSSVTFSNDNL